jgi:hypothetical protein
MLSLRHVFAAPLCICLSENLYLVTSVSFEFRKKCGELLRDFSQKNLMKVVGIERGTLLLSVARVLPDDIAANKREQSRAEMIFSVNGMFMSCRCCKK